MSCIGIGVIKKNCISITAHRPKCIEITSNLGVIVKPDAPILSLPSEAPKNTTIHVDITNFDANGVYDYTITGGVATLYIGDPFITWDLPDVAVDTDLYIKSRVRVNGVYSVWSTIATVRVKVSGVENRIVVTYIGGGTETFINNLEFFMPPIANLNTALTVTIEDMLPTIVSLEEICDGATSLISFTSNVSTSNISNFFRAWQDCTSLPSFPLIDTSSGIDFGGAWYNCQSLSSFPLIDTSSGIEFDFAWLNCSSLPSFPSINTSSGTNFRSTWQYCSSLSSFPSINTDSATNLGLTWGSCTSLTSHGGVTDCTYTDSTTWLNCPLLIPKPCGW